MDIEMHSIQRGTGPVLFLLHGNGEDSSYFSGQIPVLADWFHVIAPDTRGHGRTPRGKAPFTIHQFAEDLSIYMEENNITRAHLLGFSDGANIAMDFAIHHPDKVLSLVLNGGNLKPSGLRFSVFLPIALEYLTGVLLKRKDRKQELLALMVKDPSFDADEMNRLTVPTLVLAGNRDMIRESETEEIARRIPGSTLRILPGTHFVAKENPDAFNRCVLQFWKDQGFLH